MHGIGAPERPPETSARVSSGAPNGASQPGEPRGRRISGMNFADRGRMGLATGSLFVVALMLTATLLAWTGESPGVSGPEATPLDGSTVGHPALATMPTLARTVSEPNAPVVAGSSARSLTGSPVGEAWANVTAGSTAHPTTRSVIAEQVAYDPVDGYWVLFGGLASTGAVLNDTWSYANGSWMELAPAHSPPPLDHASMVWDPVDGYLLLFGGATTGYVAQSETWMFLHGEWTQLNPTVAPGPRWGAAMTWDPSEGYALLFGGCDYSVVKNDTWSFVGGNWTNLTGSAAPPAREDASLAFDSAAGYAVLFGGQAPYGVTGHALNDTWEYSNATWKNLTSGAAPSARYGAGLGDFPALGGLVLHGGASLSGAVNNQTWRLRSGTWTEEVTEGIGPAETMGGFASDRAFAIVALDGVRSPFSSVNSTWVYYALNLTVTPSAVTGEAPLNVTFGSTAVGGTSPIAVDWSFGDGTNGTGESPSHVYRDAGNYTVRVYAGDGLGVASYLNFTIQVLPQLLVSATAAPLSGTAPLTVTFNASVEGGMPPYTFDWTASAGVSVPGSTLVYTYNAPGVYNASFVVGDSLAVWVTRNFTIQVNPSIPPAPALSGSLAILPNLPEVLQPITFAADVTGGVPSYSYTWTGLPSGCASANAATVTCTSTASGRFDVNVTAHDSGTGVTQASALVTIAAALNVSINASAFGGCGSPLEWVFTASSAGGWPQYEYAWTFSEGQSARTSTNPTVEHVFGEPIRGPYAYANLTVTDAAGVVAHSSYLASLASSCPAQPATASSLAVPEGIAIAAVGLIAAAAIVWVGRRKRA